jgi:hypothetical protein
MRPRVVTAAERYPVLLRFAIYPSCRAQPLVASRIAFVLLVEHAVRMARPIADAILDPHRLNRARRTVFVGISNSYNALNH